MAYETPYTIDFYNMKDDAQFEAYVNRVFKLPDSLKKAMMSFESAVAIEEQIKPALNLDEQAVANLTRVIRDIMLGDLYAGDIVRTLQERADLDEVRARRAAEMIVNYIFSPIMNELRQIQANAPRRATPSVTTARPAFATSNKVIDLRKI